MASDPSVCPALLLVLGKLLLASSLSLPVSSSVILPCGAAVTECTVLASWQGT